MCCESRELPFAETTIHVFTFGLKGNPWLLDTFFSCLPASNGRERAQRFWTNLMGQNSASRRPQVLVHVAMYQCKSLWGSPMFDPDLPFPALDPFSGQPFLGSMYPGSTATIFWARHPRMGT